MSGSHAVLHYRAPAIERPTALLYGGRARRNIDRMIARAGRAGVRLRPHFKTHQSLVIGRWFRERGITAITVSSVAMARAFARDGWNDITIAIPVNLRELDVIDRLAGAIDLGLLVDDEAAVHALGGRLSARARVWIKIDAGYGRAGIRWDRPERVIALARAIGRFPRLRFEGILTHSGHSYRAGAVAGVLRVHEESLARMREVRAALAGAGFADVRVSVGDTPTCSLATEFPGVDEIRPGNFVFFDLMQLRLGVCAPGDLALAVACPVIGRYPERVRLLLHGGTVHLSAEWLPSSPAARDGESAAPERVFGCLAVQEPAAREPGSTLGLPDRDLPLVALTQEHGMARVPAEAIEDLRLGDLVLVHPVHSCITANLHREYRVLEGGTIPRI